MRKAIVSEYVDLHEQIAVEALFVEAGAPRLFDRLDQLWYMMTDDDRAEAQRLLAEKAGSHAERRAVEGPPTSPPLTDDALRSASALVDQVVARSLMPASSVEIETLRRLVRDYRAPQQVAVGRRGGPMRFRSYSRGAVVAYAFDAEGAIGFRYADGRGLLRTSDGVPRSVIAGADVADLIVILGCVVADLDQEACTARGVEVAA